MCLNTGTPKNINFSFETNGKLMALGVPILKHFRLCIVSFWAAADNVIDVLAWSELEAPFRTADLK